MKSKTAKIIILVSYLLAIYLGIFFFIALPFFIIGVGALWSVSNNWKSNLLWTIIPILLWPSGMRFLYHNIRVVGTYFGPKQDFIFEEGFRGNCMIVKDMSCGQAKILNNGREQFFIPINGLLLYQEDVSGRYATRRFFLKNETDSLIEISKEERDNFYSYSGSPPRRDKISVFDRMTGGHQQYNRNGLNFEYTFFEFIVTPFDSLKHYYDVNGRNIRQSFDSLVMNCPEMIMLR
ncbi:MAG: hypothetical protein AB8G22_22740 [Saprospiraceae bacterium]